MGKIFRNLQNYTHNKKRPVIAHLRHGLIFSMTQYINPTPQFNEYSFLLALYHFWTILKIYSKYVDTFFSNAMTN